MNENNRKKYSPFIVFISSLMWAGDSPFRKPLLVGGLGAAFIGFLEHVFNAAASLPGLIKDRAQFKLVSAKQWAGLFYIGAGASALAALLYVNGAVAMNYNFTVANLLQKVQPLFAIVLAVIFLKEKLPAKFWLYAIPALVGAYLVTFGLANPLGIWNSAGPIGLKGPLLAVLAAVLWAGGTVVGRSLMMNLKLNFVNGMRFIFGLLFLFVYVAVTKGFQFSQMTGLMWRNVFIIAMLTGFVALLIYYYGLRYTKASVATLMELGYPLASIVINWKFLGIKLDVWQIVGALVLLGSVTLLVLNSSAANSDQNEPRQTT